MNSSIENNVLTVTRAQSISSATVIQSLWSNYGEIVRLQLEGSIHPSVILKHIKLPETANHPRGWNTGHSHQRKIRSYQVEALWYQNYAQQCGSDCPVPDCLAVDRSENETVLLLTDLDAVGFNIRKDSAEMTDIYACLDWLASFHATFLGSKADGLWECGTYWHLGTRPDELAALEDYALKDAALVIDQQLQDCQYQTLVHGDAKLANFCFTADPAKLGVAAVDFQYIGRGCGVKDVAYFIGSCMDENQCEVLESTLLDYYFLALSRSVEIKHAEVNVIQLENQWRQLYDVAWADFHRFLKGWSPEHWKINSYSERLTRRVIDRLQS